MVPEPGMPRTARWVTRRSVMPFSIRLAMTAEPSPPSGWWSSATMMRPPVAVAAAARVVESSGLIEYASMTRAVMP